MASASTTATRAGPSLPQRVLARRLSLNALASHAARRVAGSRASSSSSSSSSSSAASACAVSSHLVARRAGAALALASAAAVPRGGDLVRTDPLRGRGFDAPRHVARAAGGQGGYLLGGRKSKDRYSDAAARVPPSPEESLDDEENARVRRARFEEEERQRYKNLPVKMKIRYALRRLDSDGYWAVISSGIVFGTFLLESYNMSSFGGWDVLYRDDINPMTGLISMQDLTDIEDAYNALFFFEFCLRAWAADFKKEFWLNPVTAVDFLATAPPALALIGMMESASPVYRFLRLLRVLRLLRLLDRNADSVLFGLVKTDSMGVQLIGIGAEFVCIFIIAAGVIFDLEYAVNENVNTLNDTLYWAILTLTGIGQPFEVVTAGGRIATVLSIAVALIVVPGQLAKLATVAGAQDIMSGMFITDEGSSEDSFDSMDEDPMISSDWDVYGGPPSTWDTGDGGANFTPPTAASAATLSENPRLVVSDTAAGLAPLGMSVDDVAAARMMGSTAAGGVATAGATLAMRPKRWDGRECDQCGLQIHESDARFCRRCGERLGLTESAGTLYVKKDPAVVEKRKKRTAQGSRNLSAKFKPAASMGGGMRLGLDISGAMQVSSKAKSKSKSKKKRDPSGGAKKREEEA